MVCEHQGFFKKKIELQIKSSDVALKNPDGHSTSFNGKVFVSGLVYTGTDHLLIFTTSGTDCPSVYTVPSKPYHF